MFFPYRSLLARWADHLTPDEQAALTRLAARVEARAAYACPTGDTEADVAGFVAFSRVFGNTPMPLFGQDTPALAYTRFTIARAVRGADGAYTPGDVLFEARMSDRALTTLIMEPNQGNGAGAMTAERLGTTTLPPYTAPQERPGDAAFDTARAEQAAKLDSVLADLRSAASSGASAKARTALAEALSRLTTRVRGHGGLDFLVEQRISTMGKRRVELVSEAAHAALHADRLADAFTQPRLAPPDVAPFDRAQERSASPVYDAVLDPMEPEERAAVLRVLDLERDAMIANGANPDAFTANNRRTWPGSRATLGFAQADRARVEELGSIARAAIHKERDTGPHGIVAGIIWAQGWTGFMHTSLPSNEGRHATLRLEAAWMEHSHGEGRIRSTNSPIFEIMLSPDDLMMALRGHPTGAMTPCTFRRVAGHDLPYPRQDRATPLTSLGKAQAKRVEEHPATQAVLQAIRDLEAHLATPGTSAEWKARTAALAAAIESAIPAYVEVLESEGFGRADDLVAQAVGGMVRADLNSIHASLPPGALPLLLGQ